MGKVVKVNIVQVVPPETKSEPGKIMLDGFDKVIIALLDCSFSMASDNKLRNAWKALSIELTPRLEDHALGIIQFPSFGVQTERRFGFSRMDPIAMGNSGWLIKPVRITSLSHLPEPRCVGNTPLMGGLDLAWNWLKEHAEQARIILFTDGEPTDAPKPSIIKRAIGHAVPVDTVGIRGRSALGYSEYDAEFLKELSEATGGIFTEIDSSYINLSALVKSLSPVERKALGTPN